jgi:hypothetical protein
MIEDYGVYIAAWLNHFPEVRWDRFIDTGEQVSVYGWIDRDDGKADFLLMEFVRPEEPEAAGTMGVGYTTSSAEYSEVFFERIYHSEADEHFKCQRVEHAAFGALVSRAIRLAEAA